MHVLELVADSALLWLNVCGCMICGGSVYVYVPYVCADMCIPMASSTLISFHHY